MLKVRDIISGEVYFESNDDTLHVEGDVAIRWIGTGGGLETFVLVTTSGRFKTERREGSLYILGILA